MTINKQSQKLVGITEQDFLDWCKENKKPSYKISTKREFFRNIEDGKIIRDENGKLHTLRKNK